MLREKPFWGKEAFSDGAGTDFKKRNPATHTVRLVLFEKKADFEKYFSKISIPRPFDVYQRQNDAENHNNGLFARGHTRHSFYFSGNTPYSFRQVIAFDCFASVDGKIRGGVVRKNRN